MIIQQVLQLLLITDQSVTFTLCLPSFLPLSHACLCLCHPHLSHRPVVWGLKSGAVKEMLIPCVAEWQDLPCPGQVGGVRERENGGLRLKMKWIEQPPNTVINCLPSIHYLPMPDGCHQFISSPYIMCVHMRVQRQVHEYVGKCAHE